MPSSVSVPLPGAAGSKTATCPKLRCPLLRPPTATQRGADGQSTSFPAPIGAGSGVPGEVGSKVISSPPVTAVHWLADGQATALTWLEPSRLTWTGSDHDSACAEGVTSTHPATTTTSTPCASTTKVFTTVLQTVPRTSTGLKHPCRGQTYPMWQEEPSGRKAPVAAGAS